MELRKISAGGVSIVVAEEQGKKVLTDVSSALDLLGYVRYHAEASRVILDKDAIHEDFFVLSTGFAGEVLQKFVNYRMKLAIVGDFSGYTSKPLHDFIYESNKGRDIFFVSTEEEAVKRLSAAG